MTEEELIREFLYSGCDIASYQGNIEIVNADEGKFIDKSKKSIATTRTFSCTNLLAYTHDFAYLAHMYPSETIGLNNDFDKRLSELKQLLKHYQPNEINVLISQGISNPNVGKQDFHDLTYLYNKLNILGKDCEELKINLNLLPIMKSKYLLFDLENNLLHIDNPNKEVMDVNLLQEKAIKLTKDYKKIKR